MRKGMPGLSLLVQEHFKRDPFAGDVFIFRGRAGSLIKCLWHDGLGLSLYAKRLDRGRFIWPAASEGVISLDHVPGILPPGRRGLAQPPTDLATQVGRIKNLAQAAFRGATSAQKCDSIGSWTPILTIFRTMSRP
jgi:transposase